MKGIKTRTGNIPFPAFIPVTRLGTRGGVDAKVQPLLGSVVGAVMTGFAEFEHKNVIYPRLPVMVTSGSSALLLSGSVAARRGDTGEIYLPSRKKKLVPERVLEVQEANADVAFSFDFPIQFGLDPIEAFRRQDLTVSCALWAAKAVKRDDLPIYACVQGWDKDSYRQCANAYKGTNFAGLAVGGLSTRAGDLSYVLAAVEAVLEEANGKPVHVFNQGDPRMVGVLMNEMGVDSVSSNSWIFLANEGRFWNKPTARVLKPSAQDKVLIALWNLACATGKKADELPADVVSMERAIDKAESSKNPR